MDGGGILVVERLLTADELKHLDYTKTFVELVNADLEAAVEKGQRAIHLFAQSQIEAFNLAHLFDANGYNSRATKIVHEVTPYNWVEEWKIDVEW